MILPKEGSCHWITRQLRLQDSNSALTCKKLKALENTYHYLKTCFEKELLRQQSILLDENEIDYKIEIIKHKAHFRAPLSGYFESEIHVSENDYAKAENLLTVFKE